MKWKFAKEGNELLSDFRNNANRFEGAFLPIVPFHFPINRILKNLSNVLEQRAIFYQWIVKFQFSMWRQDKPTHNHNEIITLLIRHIENCCTHGRTFRKANVLSRVEQALPG